MAKQKLKLAWQDAADGFSSRAEFEADTICQVSYRHGVKKWLFTVDAYGNHPMTGELLVNNLGATRGVKAGVSTKAKAQAAALRALTKAVRRRDAYQAEVDAWHARRAAEAAAVS